MSEQRFKSNPARGDDQAPVINTLTIQSSSPSCPVPAVAILDEEKVQAVTSLSRTTRWRMERRGEFPKRVRLSPGRVGWRQADIEAWIISRAASICLKRFLRTKEFSNYEYC
jgi:prophage regulatory protein